MKKTISIILLCALVLSGCAGEPVQAPDEGESPAAEREYTQGELEALDDYAMHQFHFGNHTRSERGAYYYNRVDSRSLYYIRLDYIDMQEGVIKPLCHIEGCAHDNPDCEAFMPTDGLKHWRVFNYGDMMFILRPSAWSDDDAPQKALRPAGIEIADVDGANRRELIAYDAATQPAPYDAIHASQNVGAISIGSLCCDGRYLYYTLREITQVDYISYKNEFDSGVYASDIRCDAYLVKLDIESGEEVSRVPYINAVGDESVCLGVYRNKLLYYGVKLDENGDYMQSASGRQFTLSYYTVDFATGEVKQVFEEDVDMDAGRGDTGDILFAGGELYQVREEEGAMYLLNPDSGEFTKVFDAPDDWANFNIRTRGGRYLFYATFADGEGQYYVADGLDKPLAEFTPMRMTGDGYKDGQELQLYGETESDFLLVTDYVERDFSAVTSSGELIVEKIPCPIYALISKTDYWNGNPSFRDIVEVE